MRHYLPLATAIFCIAIINPVFAGTGLGGGGAVQLQEMASSETMLPASEIQKVYSDTSLSLETENMQHTGILIEVQPSSFALIAIDAANGRDFLYQDAEARPISISASKTIVLQLMDNPSVIILIKNVEQ